MGFKTLSASGELSQLLFELSDIFICLMLGLIRSSFRDLFSWQSESFESLASFVSFLGYDEVLPDAWLETSLSESFIFLTIRVLRILGFLRFLSWLRRSYRSISSLLKDCIEFGLFNLYAFWRNCQLKHQPKNFPNGVILHSLLHYY